MFLKLFVLFISLSLCVNTLTGQSPPKVPQLFPNQPSYPQQLSVYTKPKNMDALPLSIKALQTIIPKSPNDSSCSQTLGNILQFLFEREFVQNPRKSTCKPRLEADATKLLINAKSEATQKMLQELKEATLEATKSAVQQILLRNGYPSPNVLKVAQINPGYSNYGPLAVQNGQRFIQRNVANLNPVVNYVGRSVVQPTLNNHLTNSQIVGMGTPNQFQTRQQVKTLPVNSVDSSLNENSLKVVYRTKTVPITKFDGNVLRQMYQNVLVPYTILKVL